MSIDKHIKIMKDYEKSNYWILIRLRLAHPVLIEYCDEFIQMKKKDVTKDILDNIKCIIVYCKTIDDVGKYPCPYEDDMYDLLLCRYKQFAPEPFGLDSIGLANVKYKYAKLAGTLDKVHHIYNAEKTSNKDSRPSLEEYLSSSDLRGKTIRALLNRKEDGASVVAEYVLKGNEYVAERGISRGRKDYGEGSDVSPIVKGLKFDAKPMKDLLGFMPTKIGVQYEMEVSDKMKLLLEAYRKATFSNNRSAVIGLMRKIVFASGKELKELRKFVSLVPVGFELQGDNKTKTDKFKYEEIYDAVVKTFIYGDIEISYNLFEGTPKELLDYSREYADSLLKERESINHDIDGVVITICNKSLREKLGRANNINKFQIAFKFPEQAKKTTIIGLITTTGAFGYKEFLAETETVLLNGTKQNKGQFHSLTKFRKFDPRIGDEVFLKLAGDVIPFLYTDDTCKKGTGPKLILPTECDCKTKLIETKSKLRCPNEKCEYRLIGALTTFLTEVNSKGIGEETCKSIYQKLGVEKASSLLKLTRDDFIKLPGFAKDSAKLAEQTITDIIDTPKRASVILSSLGIDSFRSSTAGKVLDVYTLDEIRDVINPRCDDGLNKLITMLKTVKGIDKNATTIANGLIAKRMELEQLLDILTISDVVKFKSDKVILVSGLRQDDELEALAQKHGYEIKFSTKKYDILVVKDEKSLSKGKALEAKKNNKKIYTRSEFFKEFK